MKQIAIIGAGPSGFYTAQQLLKHSTAHITILEKRLVPYGLVRYGVAPDHPEVKNAISKFEKIALDDRVSYFGNCKVGQQLNVEELKTNFDAVVFSYGPDTERDLGIDLKEAGNIYSAQDFVGWYNGDPDTFISPCMDCETAVIIGHGNVALDCARILLSPTDYLAKTDITDRALKILESSRIKNVVVVGRRGAMQASFTNKEVRELMSLPDVKFNTCDDIKVYSFGDDTSKILVQDRSKKRLIDILLKGSNSTTNTKSWQLNFLSSPISVETQNGQLSGIWFEKNVLVGQSPKAQGTGEKYLIKCGMLIKSIGYLNQGIEGIPFSRCQNSILNIGGRISNGNQIIPGLYTSGWIKSGPVGVITSTVFDSAETARNIIDDMSNIPDSGKLGYVGLQKLGIKYGWTSFEDWKKIDRFEIEMGRLVGKPREKVCTIAEMQNIIKTANISMP